MAKRIRPIWTLTIIGCFVSALTLVWATSLTSSLWLKCGLFVIVCLLLIPVPLLFILARRR